MARRSKRKIRSPRGFTAGQDAGATVAAGEGENTRIDRVAAELSAEVASGPEGGAGDAVVGQENHLTPELEALAAEAAASPLGAAAPGAGHNGGPPLEEPVTISDADFASIVAPAIGVVGNGLCRRFKVEPLEGDEIGALTMALVRLANAYDILGQLDPRTAAWIAVATTAGGIITRRLPRASAPLPAGVEMAPPEPAPGAPTYSAEHIARAAEAGI